MNPDDFIGVYTDKILSSPFGDTHDINERTGDVIYNGTEAQVSDALSILNELSFYVNAQQLPYNPTPISSSLYNSNSAANSIWNVLNQFLTLPSNSLQDFKGFFPRITNDVLQGNTWFPNIDSSNNIIGSNVQDTGNTNELIGTEHHDELYGFGR
ncbi:MAG: hypothetical protein R3E13_11980 [Alphaproteobacteria bacterium]